MIDTVCVECGRAEDPCTNPTCVARNADIHERMKNPQCCYGCGHIHTGPASKTGDRDCVECGVARDGKSNCLGFCRDDATAMEALGIAVSSMGFDGKVNPSGQTMTVTKRQP